ncbi:hypothetical protein VT84_33665 [Gemmata sp. SH-PL17]|uniref:hypothetical protein n=1 Tax=Gemmata sp. SH-PL17 TaxID=1630693 RepID=UPI00078D5B39|nr:hypothetical protein [Gemmata sp. SH-PL17]AMV29391.1 hypothetical protein VT84_33665 [Gemmata sp. SH-PL17]
MRERVLLRFTALRFVSQESDLDEPPLERTLTVTRDVFDNAVALAKTQGWKEPGRKMRCRYLSVGHVGPFVDHVRQALAAPVVVAGRASPARFSTAPDLRSFFARPANAQALNRVLDLLANKGSLVVEDL